MSAFSIDDKDNISNYRVTQASHGFSKGEFLRLNGSTYQKAQADNETNAEVVGMVSEVIDVNTFKLRVIGRQIGLSGLTAGTVYYLSDSVAGGITSTEPSLSKPVLLADSSTSGILLTYRGVTDAGGGGGTLAMELLTSTTVTSPVSSVDFTSGIDGTYSKYVIEVDSLTSTSSDTYLVLRTSGDTGSTFDSGATDYIFTTQYHINTGATGSGGSGAGFTGITLNTDGSSLGFGTSSKGQMTIKIAQADDSSTITDIMSDGSYESANGSSVRMTCSGYRNSASTVDAVRLLFNTGNIATGTFKLYGIK